MRPQPPTKVNLQHMRKLVESTFVTLDGVISSPEKWGSPYWNDEHDIYAHDLLLDLRAQSVRPAWRYARQPNS